MNDRIDILRGACAAYRDLRASARRTYLERMAEANSGGLPEKRSGSTFITDGFPEAGGGASAATEAAPGTDSGSGSDDDDGGDADPEPRRSRQRPHEDKQHTTKENAHALRPSRADMEKSLVNTKAAVSGAIPAASPSIASPCDPSIELWRLPTVLQHVPISRSSWFDGVKSGRYPAPVRISTRCVAWRSSDIRSLIASL
jgi:prophage regulatory protein